MAAVKECKERVSVKISMDYSIPLQTLVPHIIFYVPVSCNLINFQLLQKQKVLALILLLYLSRFALKDFDVLN